MPGVCTASCNKDQAFVCIARKSLACVVVPNIAEDGMERARPSCSVLGLNWDPPSETVLVKGQSLGFTLKWAPSRSAKLHSRRLSARKDPADGKKPDGDLAASS